MKNNYTYFQNEECEHFPCHKNAEEDFNCLFCYCPLYALGDKCGGNFVYIGDGVKDCSNCLVPHSKNGYSYVLSKIMEVCELAKRNQRIEE